MILALVPAAMGYNGITVSGSSTVMPLVESCAEAFNVQQSTYHVSVSSGGTGAGITNVAEGRSDIAMASRELTVSEMSRYGDSFKEFLVGYDGLCVAVSREVYDSGVKALTNDQVKKIYSGEISNWKLVGGPDREIYVIAREQGSGTRDTFNEVIMGKRDAELPGVDEHGSVETGNAGVKTALVGSRQAIGYLGYSYVNDNSLGIVDLDGIKPTIETIRSGAYPLARKLYLYTFGEPKPGAKVFIDFVISPEGQAIAQEMGFVPI
ncbi:MAG TPA: phosphate ABC transporter substrate-binding protein [Methanotrichaceae archaeon]|nr:phosphate ABC transporter substrate-binding protein [Methanotrichaceae archaeon]